VRYPVNVGKSRNEIIRGLSSQSQRLADLVASLPRYQFARDRIGTAFGNSATGIVDGPGQANIDIAFSKGITIHESSSIQFRAEFFNLFNHPQFANPDANFTSPTFGVISSTAVNARVGQVAVRFSFWRRSHRRKDQI